jgi:hypothetical protein
MPWNLVFPSLNEYPEVTAGEISAFEARHSLRLPQDYAQFLLRYRGSPPMLQNERGDFRGTRFPVDWGNKPARSLGPECSLVSTFSIFEGKDIESPYKGGCDLGDNILWNEHLHPPGLLPIGMNAGNSLFMLGLARELAGQVFFLSTFHVPSPMSFDHVGFVARSFTDFLSAARPDDPPLP